MRDKINQYLSLFGSSRTTIVFVWQKGHEKNTQYLLFCLAERAREKHTISVVLSGRKGFVV